ncbi:MAG: cellulase family glycosylhydrolase [Cystobacter sp.]
MRGALTGGLLLLGTACGGDTPVDVLEEEAASCPEAPAMRLGAAPSAAVVLNAYYLQEQAARDVRQGLAESPVVDETLAKASALGAWAVRTNGFNDGVTQLGDSALHVGPHAYDETAFRGLDRVLARASVYGVKLVLSLGNYWDAYGGTRRYVEWAGLPAPVQGDARFFTERPVIDLYTAHVAHLLSRVNTLDGRRYGEHPAVLGWELLNEPRGQGLDAEGATMRAWVDEVAAVVKRHAPGHLVGTGEEGFESEGSSFRRNTASPSIDFASVHFYPEDYGVPREDIAWVGARWFSTRAAVARELGKPLFIGEFGLHNTGGFSLEERRALYRGWLRCAWTTGVAASAPWMLANDSRPDAWDDFTFYFRDGSEPSHPDNRYADLVIEAAARAGTR